MHEVASPGGVGTPGNTNWANYGTNVTGTAVGVPGSGITTFTWTAAETTAALAPFRADLVSATDATLVNVMLNAPSGQTIAVPSERCREHDGIHARAQRPQDGERHGPPGRDHDRVQRLPQRLQNFHATRA